MLAYSGRTQSQLSSHQKYRAIPIFVMLWPSQFPELQMLGRGQRDRHHLWIPRNSLAGSHSLAKRSMPDASNCFACSGLSLSILEVWRAAGAFNDLNAIKRRTRRRVFPGTSAGASIIGFMARAMPLRPAPKQARHCGWRNTGDGQDKLSPNHPGPPSGAPEQYFL